MSSKQGLVVPFNSFIDNGDNRFTNDWVMFLGQLAVSGEHGPTASRPTKNLWVGRRYFDETLGYPVYVKQVTPTIIWVNGAGSAV